MSNFGSPDTNTDDTAETHVGAAVNNAMETNADVIQGVPGDRVDMQLRDKLELGDKEKELIYLAPVYEAPMPMAPMPMAQVHEAPAPAAQEPSKQLLRELHSRILGTPEKMNVWPPYQDLADPTNNAFDESDGTLLVYVVFRNKSRDGRCKFKHLFQRYYSAEYSLVSVGDAEYCDIERAVSGVWRSVTDAMVKVSIAGGRDIVRYNMRFTRCDYARGYNVYVNISYWLS